MNIESTPTKLAAFKDELTKIAVGGPASIQDFLRYVGAGLALSTGLGIASAGAQMGLSAYNKWKMDSRKDPLFNEMLQLHPELKEEKSRAALYFDALWHFSPVVAQNPLAAGAYIRQALQMDSVAGGPLPAMVRELTDIGKAHNESKPKTPGPAHALIAGITSAPEKMVPGVMTFRDWNGIP